MGNLALVRPVGALEAKPAPVDEIQICDARLRKASKSLKTNLMDIAYYGWRLRALDGFRVLGFENEEDYRKSIDISTTTWHKYVRIGQALCRLSLQELYEIPSTNAELLLQVAPEMWLEYPWVVEAKRLSSQELAMRITDRNEKAGSDRVPMTYYRVKVPFLVKDLIGETLENFRQKHELSSVGQALEMLIAEQYDRPSLLKLIYTVKFQIRSIINELSRPNVTAERRLKYTRDLEAAWRTLNEAWKKEGAEEAGCGFADEGAS